MSNGNYVVLFNDSTKIVLSANCFDFTYIRRESSKKKEPLEDLCSHHNFNEYPESLKKKVILIQHFKSYLDGVKFEAPTDASEPADKYWEIYLKKWK